MNKVKKYAIRKYKPEIGVFFLSPRCSRWIPENGTGKTKKKKGIFNYDDAVAIIEEKVRQNPEWTYNLLEIN